MKLREIVRSTVYSSLELISRREFQMKRFGRGKESATILMLLDFLLQKS